MAHAWPPVFPSGLEARLEYLINHGSSLTLNWGEDTGSFEVDWITSGRRFRGVCRDLGCALEMAESAARVLLEPGGQC
jgi:hypothetical protein